MAWHTRPGAGGRVAAADSGAASAHKWCRIKMSMSESWATVKRFTSLAGKTEPFLVICRGFMSVNREEMCRRSNVTGLRRADPSQAEGLLLTVALHLPWVVAAQLRITAQRRGSLPRAEGHCRELRIIAQS